MEDSTEVNETPDVCRLCLDDLSTFPEYYSIDEELADLTETLTGILVDSYDTSLPSSMCTNCFNIISSFNSCKLSWIENQSQFGLEMNSSQVNEVKNEGIIHEEPFEVIETTIDAVEDSQNEYDYRVEYVDEMELNDVEITSDKADEDPGDPDSDISVRGEPDVDMTRRATRAKRSTGDGNLKGKDIYQKLLKKCEECGKLIEKNRMDGHMNKHRNIRPYICEVDGCGKTFYCKLLLRLHKTSIHTGQSVKCDVCDKDFPSDRSLYSHKLRHKNEDKYNCTYCERKFNNSNSLKRHLAIHSGIREFSCEHCNSSFYRKFNLDVHIRTVHQKAKLFTCDFCPKRFGYSRLLKDHVNKSHGNRAEWFKVEA